MGTFLMYAYIVATIVAVSVLIMLCPWAMYMWKTYIGWGAYSAFAIACVVWCITFILVGLLLE